jgi:uncharacterized protein (DUF1800 family)
MPIWNKDSARHLLSRALFGYSRKDLDKALSYSTLSDFVEKELLATITAPKPPGDWISTSPLKEQIDKNLVGDWYRQFTYWWYDLMVKEGTSMRERMVMFFHNHYTSQRSKVQYPQHMYAQNKLFRDFAFGNLKDLTKAVNVDAAMIIYLDSNNSNGAVGKTPNENYARELMELFTLGIGNYTETDIKQAARALSGWSVSGLDVKFDKTRWFADKITFLGKTANFDNKMIVDHIFTQDAAAEFFCTKLYKEFVCYKPDTVFIKKMAAVMRTSNYELKPVLKFLFTSDEFYKEEVVASKIKTPTELMIGSLKALDTKTPDWTNVYDTGRLLQQQLFEPPDVAGWEGQREWISSTTYVTRGGLTDSFITGKRYNGAAVTGKTDSLAYIKSFKTSEDAVKLVDDLVALMVRFPLSATKKKFLLDTLLDGTVVTNWSTSTPMADARIQRLLKAIMRLPEYQLA